MPPARQAHFEQREIEQLAGIIAEKWSPGAVGALESRREPDNEQARAIRAERRHCTVEPIWMRRLVVVAKGYETRTKGAVLGRLRRIRLTRGPRRHRILTHSV